MKFYHIFLLLIIAPLSVSSGLATDSFVPPHEFLTIKYPEYGGGPMQVYAANKFTSLTTIFENEDCRIIWSISEPPSIATKTVVGGLFVLTSKENSWIVSDARRFEASGKYSDAKATLTSHGSIDPHVTVTLHQGGRGASWEEAASYTLKKGKFSLDSLKRGEQGATANP